MSGAIIAWPLELGGPDTEALLARARLVGDIGGREMRKRDRKAGVNHCRRKVSPAGPADRDGAAMNVDIALHASHAFADNETGEPVGRHAAARPGCAIAATALGKCGRVDAVKTNGNTGEIERFAARCARRTADVLRDRR